jgi:hypothetical protein
LHTVVGHDPDLRTVEFGSLRRGRSSGAASVVIDRPCVPRPRELLNPNSFPSFACHALQLHLGLPLLKFTERA